MLGLEAKKAIVAEVNDVASKALSAVVAEYHGLTVGQMTALRAKGRDSGVYVKVVRNTLARRAVEGTAFACLNEALVGPLVYAFAMNEPGAAARLLRDFAKDNKAMKVTAVSIDGKSFPGAHLDVIASLPTKGEAISQLMSVMLGPVTKLAQTLDAVRDSMEKQAA
ncbi:MAG: 50S ribosomal protein L10 [Gammaproteobacteria bacterium]|nr:50S ribosomal protein L10 [Gammaproteobacteria bacterium]